MAELVLRPQGKGEVSKEVMGLKGGRFGKSRRVGGKQDRLERPGKEREGVGVSGAATRC